MAEINQSTEDLARLMEEAGRQMRDYGAVTKQTESEIFDVKVKQKTGIVNATLALNKFGEATGSLAKATMSAASAMHQGQKGAAAMNGAVDGVADAAKHAAIALMAMVPGGAIIKALTVAVTAAIGAVAAYTKAANEMSDSLYKGYQGLAKSGAAASDGMTGLYKDAKKLGLSMNELDSLVSLVAENSADLAAFAGSVSNGRKRFAELGAAMEPQRQAMIRMGMMPQEINEAMAGYLRTQTRLGNAQRMTTDQLAEGARNYLREQDALTKITGQSVKETEKKREAALMEEQFAAKIRQLQLNGQHDAAKRLMLVNDMASAMSEELGRGVRAAATNNLTNADAQKLYLSTQGQIFPALNEVIAGTKSPAEALDGVTDKIIETNDKIGVSLGLLGANDKTFIAVGEAAKIRAAKESGNMADRMKAAEKDYDARLKGGTDPMLDSAASLRDAQIDANEATNEFIVKGIVPATKAMEKLARVTESAANMANDVTTSRPVTAEEANLGGGEFYAMPEQFSGRSGGSLGATGKLIEDFGSGTPMMLHGREGVVTEAQLNSLIRGAMGAASGSMPSKKSTQSTDQTTQQSNPQTVKLQNLQDEMFKDTEQLSKITDSDVRRAREFSRINLKLTELKTQTMEDEIELLEEQNEMLSQIEEIYSKTMGPEAAKAAVKAFKRTQMMSNAAMPAAGSSSASSAPTASGGPSAPSEVEGARGGGPTAKPSEVLNFTARSGSASAFEGLNSRLKDSVISAAEEYHAATGGKFQINSAKRDPADQQRLWEQSVALGTPGRGPSGMAVAKPGRSPHEHGLAVDIQNYNDPAAVAAMNRQGLKQKVPGDPVHFSFGDGGIANGPSSGYLAELHGPEAVVPLPDGKTIPVRIEGDMPGSNQSSDMAAMMNQFKSSMESMINQLNNRDLLNMMDEMVRAQKDSNSIQEKLLRAAAN
jgi:hypothetical protein